MRNTYKFVLPAVLAVGFLPCFASGQISKVEELDLKTSDIKSNFAENSLTCTSTASAPVIRVPPTLFEKAKLKARLAALLRESLNDDASGIVNIAREKEIKKLAEKLKNWRE